MKLTDIGRTPLIELASLSINGGRCFSKCEFLNPSGSHKDRTYLSIINGLEKIGAIQPGMTLVDSSTGNGGAALAWIGRLKGYKIKIFMPEGMTQERKVQIRSLGAEIIETPKEGFLSGAVLAARRYQAEQLNEQVFFLDQSNNLLNKAAWADCGEEIVEALRHQHVVPDFFVCSIGTGGTFSGIAEVLKCEYREIRTVAIEVNKSAPLYSERNNLTFEHRPHNLMGLGGGVLSTNTVSALVDEVRVVDGNEAWVRMKQFIEHERVPVGPTCGANLLVCEEVALTHQKKNIVTVFFDSSWKYASRWDGFYPEYGGVDDAT
ncbi:MULTISPECIES: cysteine synthase family protein [unclassified Pseudomonas]|jgi:cysteine synthase A|uniref:cysteine synthase family protein n=1 Tax=unclassified Pseudomonas TaxID=196821 RepID=UPI0008F0247A|nr:MULTISPECIES: cysteine synthase family protein [unclassified Pseudomonas]PMV22287.1 cysteine synthase family protein [Pseudomonas sp. FW305-3-2-15-C-TSA2]PMV23669.1 cysteine synthase family protein [Pseudomonas sp. DP16D-L5]PMV34646.1 cysteine synthase family protein [Pseudomonas sp. FW305-3-2-15-A-LB2]PMV41948.1 cysteine synthase family protein [Pseudomonas sp. FW305-3-2-15-C-R2A1]PMV46482.1 cysteine synthase family protein [Pseudomonas sp. FW305-3-2-15-C-LB1]